MAFAVSLHCQILWFLVAPLWTFQSTFIAGRNFWRQQKLIFQKVWLPENIFNTFVFSVSCFVFDFKMYAQKWPYCFQLVGAIPDPQLFLSLLVFWLPGPREGRQGLAPQRCWYWKCSRTPKVSSKLQIKSIRRLEQTLQTQFQNVPSRQYSRSNSAVLTPYFDVLQRS